MFRLVSLLVVVAILGILAVTALDPFTGGAGCSPDGTTSTLPVEMPKGVEQIVNGDC